MIESKQKSEVTDRINAKLERVLLSNIRHNFQDKWHSLWHEAKLENSELEFSMDEVTFFRFAST